MKTTIDRIYELVDFKGETIYKLSKSIDVSNGYFSKQKLSNGAISSTIIEKLVNHFPDVDLNWLITGKGKMLRTNTASTGKDCTEKIDQLKEQLAKSEELVGLQRYQLEGFAREIKRLSTEIAALKKESLPTSHSKPMAP